MGFYTHRQPCISARKVPGVLRQQWRCPRRVPTRTHRSRFRFPAVRARAPGVFSIPVPIGWETRSVARLCPLLLFASAEHPETIIIIIRLHSFHIQNFVIVYSLLCSRLTHDSIIIDNIIHRHVYRFWDHIVNFNVSRRPPERTRDYFNHQWLQPPTSHSNIEYYTLTSWKRYINPKLDMCSRFGRRPDKAGRKQYARCTASDWEE